MTTASPAELAPTSPTNDAVDVIALPSRLFVPLPSSQGCLPAGSRVNRGDVLTNASDGPGTALPLAPAAGTVLGVRQVDRIGMASTPALEIEVQSSGGDNGSAAPAAGASLAAAPPADLAELIDRLCRGGVQAQRHTSPDLLAQLTAARERKIDTIVCNLLDPGGESDLMTTIARSDGAMMLGGVNALARACGVARAWVAADTRAFAAVQASTRRASGLTSRLKVIEIANDYPQADPSLLVYALLGRRLAPRQNPVEAQVILLDGAAAAAVGRCIARGEPALDLAVEVRESDRQACSVRRVPVGTPLRFLLEQLWLRPERLTLRAGAALRDVRVDADAILDGAGELSIDAGPLSQVINPDPCIRCGWCVEACPVRIHPAGILESAQDSDFPAALRYGLNSCIECGICSYVCPSRLPLLPTIREMRHALDRKTAAG
jgi:electron transport complex protein RnfC